MNRANILASAPGLSGFIGSLTLPGIAAAASGFMGAAWFGVQIFIALEKRAKERAKAIADNPDAV